MKKTIAALFGLALLTANGCVGAKKFRYEKNTRIAAEAREKVLVQELLDRKNETASLTKMVGELNRSIGRQETEIKELEEELTDRTQSMGESATKLSSEKIALDKKLADNKALLEKRNESLQRIRTAQEKRKSLLVDVETSLNKLFQSQKNAGVTIAADAETVKLTLPDNLLFDATGLNVSTSGRNLVTTLAEFLVARPSLDVEIIAYTDNKMPPKDKTLQDTWDWSLQRATNIARMMVREYNINANQLSPIGRGEFYPVTSNETVEGRLKNRRTVVVFKPAMPVVPLAD